jgi:ABC-type Fe3+ transport system substrate-binding protein
MSQGAPLAFHWVRPIIVGQYALVVPAKAPHPNAARVFENFVLSEGHQVRWSEQIGTYSVLATVKPRRGFPPLTALRTYVPNLDVVMRDRGKIVDDYRKVMNAAK